MSVSLDESKKPFADLSNKCDKNDTNTASNKPREVVETSLQYTAELSNMTNDYVEVSNESSFLNEQKLLIQDVLMKKLLDKVHHSGGAFHTDKIADDLKEILKQYHPDEAISFEIEGQWKNGQIVSVERKGGAKFYVVSENGKKVQNKINGLNIKRKYNPTDEDIKLFINAVSTKIPGKPWEVHETLRKEYGIVNKLASLFCSTPKSKSVVCKSEESSEDDEVPLVNLRRSGAGLPPSSVKKHIEKKQKEMKKEKAKEDGEKKRKSMDAEKITKKNELKVKKEQERKETKDKKNQEKERVKVEKKELKEKAAKEKKEKSSMSIKEAFAVKKESGVPSENGSPMKLSEKRLQSYSQKLEAAFKKKDMKEFNEQSHSASKYLSLTSIEKIENELIRFAVKRQYDLRKEHDTMKGLSAAAKKAMKLKIKESRPATYNHMEHRLRVHFRITSADTSEDLELTSSPLACIGDEIELDINRKAHFPDCLMISQFLAIMKPFFEVEFQYTAEELLHALYDGRKGYVKVISKVLIIMLGSLVNIEEYRKISHMNSRLRDLVFDESTVSEICRAFLIGSQDLHTAEDRKIERRKARYGESYEVNQVDDEISIVKEEGNGGDDDEDSRSNSDLDISQLDQEEKEMLLQVFKPNLNFWELGADEQMSIIKFLHLTVLDSQSFKEFSSNYDTENITTLKAKLSECTSQLEESNKSLKELPTFDDTLDECRISRHESRERTEVLKKRKDFENQIEEFKIKLEELQESLVFEQLSANIHRGIIPIGQDRHLRSYFMFPVATRDGGLWIQQFDESQYEKLFVKNSSKSPKNRPSPTKKPPSRRESENFSSPIGPPDSATEKWFRVSKTADLPTLIAALGNFGIRERSLKKYLTTNLASIEAFYQNMVSKLKEDEDEDEEKEIFEEAPALLRTDILNISKDLCASYLSNLDYALFEGKVVSVENLDGFKALLNEFMDSIPESAIETRCGLDTGFYSAFKVERWKRRLQEAQNISSIILLLKILDSRILWKNSVAEKQCCVCGSRKERDTKISCKECKKVYHYYCTRPRLSEKPTSYLCVSCSRRQAPSKPKYVDTEDGSPLHGSPCEDDETEDDDYFSSKNRHRASKRKAASNFGLGDDISRSKRIKISPAAAECKKVFEKMKQNNRMYRKLKYVQIPRQSRNRRSISLESIENELESYESVDHLKNDLLKFLTAARTYFEEHNERMLEELDNLIIELDLTE